MCESCVVMREGLCVRRHLCVIEDVYVSMCVDDVDVRGRVCM